MSITDWQLVHCRWACRPDAALSAGSGHGEVVHRGGAANVRVGDQPELAECRQSTIDSRPVNSRSRCLGAGDDLLGSEVLLGAVQNLDDGLASSGHAFVTVAEQAQRGLDAGR